MKCRNCIYKRINFLANESYCTILGDCTGECKYNDEELKEMNRRKKKDLRFV